MAYTKIPPRSEFKVTEEIFEFFRSITVALDEIDRNDSDDKINSLLGLFKQLEDSIRNLTDITDNPDVTILSMVNALNGVIDRLSLIDTTELLNAKIRELEETVSLLPEESELSLFKAFKGLEVKTYEYTGTIAAASLTANVAITGIIGQGECFVEIRTPGDGTFPLSSDYVTSEFTSSTNVILTRNNSASTINYVLKVKDFQNG